MLVFVINLQSSNRSLLNVPTIKTFTYGQRSFSYAAAKLWNDLPETIKSATSLVSFKSSLKTILFKKVYDIM
jgi:hypothetical protein